MKANPYCFFLLFLVLICPASFFAEEIVKAPPPVEWTAEELRQDIAVRKLRDTGRSSMHAIRLRTAEKAHVHDAHDVSVLMTRGRAKVHTGERTEEMRKGSRIFIPRGAVHWAENTGPEPCEVFATFVPSYDGKDYREV